MTLEGGCVEGMGRDMDVMGVDMMGECISFVCIDRRRKSIQERERSQNERKEKAGRARRSEKCTLAHSNSPYSGGTATDYVCRYWFSARSGSGFNTKYSLSAQPQDTHLILYMPWRLGNCKVGYLFYLIPSMSAQSLPIARRNRPNPQEGH